MSKQLYYYLIPLIFIGGVGTPASGGELVPLAPLPNPMQLDQLPTSSKPSTQLRENDVTAAKPSATRLNWQDVNAADYTGGPLPEGLSAVTLKLEIILDQVGMSPGVIDGINGKNVAKAVSAVEMLTGQSVDGLLNEETWARLPHDTPILVDYVITPEDLAGPFLPEIPTDFAEMAK